MTYSKFIYFYCFVFLLIQTACRTEKAKTEIQLSGLNKVLLLDSLSATRAIVKDDLEHFFDNITPVDMMIQMHKDYPLQIPLRLRKTESDNCLVVVRLRAYNSDES